ncbi:MAG: TolC family protein [Bacteroidetes bacterium]|nr:TolC family protein [Bacteroidota bacterium]
MRYLLYTFLLTLFCASLSAQKNLDYFLSQGLQNSPLLKDYQFQVQGNKIDSQRLKASFGPQVTGNTTGSYSPVVKGWGYDGAITNLHTYNALIGVSRVIVGKDNLNNQYLSFQLQNLGLQNQGKISEQDLKRSIIQQYITAYGDLLQINFNEEIITLLKNEEAILKKLAEKGVYKQTDFLSFLVNIQQQELLIKQLHIQYQNDYATLNYITGVRDTVFTQLEMPLVSPEELPALDETVFYNQFVIDSLKIKNNDKQIDYNYKPRVSLFADGGYNSSFAITPYKNFGLSAGIALTVPIYDGKQRRMQHQKNAIAEQNRKNYLEFYSTQYSQQIAQLNQQLLLTQQMIEQTATQVKYAEGLITAQRQQLVTGDVRIADYIIAIGNYLNAKNSITLNTINKLQIINQINYWNRKL